MPLPLRCPEQRTFGACPGSFLALHLALEACSLAVLAHQPPCLAQDLEQLYRGYKNSYRQQITASLPLVRSFPYTTADFDRPVYSQEAEAQQRNKYFTVT